MNKKIKPQDDFYNSVNKEWLDQAELPAGYSSWGSFEILNKKSNDDVNKLIEDLVTKSELTNTQKQIVNIYNNFLDFDSRNKQGLEPIQAVLAEVDMLTDKEKFTDFLIEMNTKYCISLFHSKSIDIDFKDSNVRALSINSMNLGMTDKDFYEPTHVRHDEIKKAYQKYVNDLAKYSKINFKSKDLFGLLYKFEEDLCPAMLRREELRDIERVYNLFTVPQLQELCPFINWSKYLSAQGYDKAAKIIVGEPEFFKKLNKLLEAMSFDDFKDLILFEIIDGYTGMLTAELEKITFEYGSVFSGIKEMKPVRERAVSFTNSLIGDLIGQEYVKIHFTETSKKDVLKIVNDLIVVYKERINHLEWMSDPTKKRAIEKLDTFDVKIGYPDKFEDYSKIEIRSYSEGGSLFENILNIAKFFLQKELDEINLPVDKTKWYMNPQTVNAYYNPLSNEICFPAGILQAPFYDINQSHAKNLGGIGTVIGHEVSHGFDDEGSKFDKDGNMNNWWEEEDYKQYNLRTQKLIEQYSAYEIDGSNVNGKLTLGENIGDLGGLNAALDICLKQCPNDIKEFFENYALVWKRKSTPENMNTRLMTDPHSPEIFRCNGILINVDKFHEIYETKPGDGMYKAKEDRIKIW